MSRVLKWFGIVLGVLGSFFGWLGFVRGTHGVTKTFLPAPWRGRQAPLPAASIWHHVQGMPWR
jgi:hypothetical protein